MVVLATWIGIATISSVVFLIGGVNQGNFIFVGILVFVGFITSFGVPFGLGPESILDVDVENKIMAMDKQLEKLTEMVEEMKKEFEV